MLDAQEDWLSSSSDEIYRDMTVNRISFSFLFFIFKSRGLWITIQGKAPITDSFTFTIIHDDTEYGEKYNKNLVKD